MEQTRAYPCSGPVVRNYWPKGRCFHTMTQMVLRNDCTHHRMVKHALEDCFEVTRNKSSMASHGRAWLPTVAQIIRSLGVPPNPLNPFRIDFQVKVCPHLWSHIVTASEAQPASRPALPPAHPPSNVKYPTTTIHVHIHSCDGLLFC